MLSDFFFIFIYWFVFCGSLKVKSPQLNSSVLQTIVKKKTKQNKTNNLTRFVSLLIDQRVSVGSRLFVLWFRDAGTFILVFLYLAWWCSAPGCSCVNLFGYISPFKFYDTLSWGFFPSFLFVINSDHCGHTLWLWCLGFLGIDLI